VLTRTVRGSATATYWVWVATSLNFVLPLGAILDKSLASHLSWARPLGVIGEIGLEVADHASLVGTVWLLGACSMATRLGLRIRAARLRAEGTHGAAPAKPDFFFGGTPVRFTATENGPRVDGLLRPHICLPNGIDRLLTRSELEAVLLHE